MCGPTIRRPRLAAYRHASRVRCIDNCTVTNKQVPKNCSRTRRHQTNVYLIRMRNDFRPILHNQRRPVHRTNDIYRDSPIHLQHAAAVEIGHVIACRRVVEPGHFEILINDVDCTRVCSVEYNHVRRRRGTDRCPVTWLAPVVGYGKTGPDDTGRRCGVGTDVEIRRCSGGADDDLSVVLPDDLGIDNLRGVYRILDRASGFDVRKIPADQIVENRGIQKRRIGDITGRSDQRPRGIDLILRENIQRSGKTGECAVGECLGGFTGTVAKQ